MPHCLMFACVFSRRAQPIYTTHRLLISLCFLLRCHVLLLLLGRSCLEGASLGSTLLLLMLPAEKQSASYFRSKQLFILVVPSQHAPATHAACAHKKGHRSFQFFSIPFSVNYPNGTLATRPCCSSFLQCSAQGTPSYSKIN